MLCRVESLNPTGFTSSCLVLWRTLKLLVLCTYVSVNRLTLCTLKNITGYSKRAGDHPGLLIVRQNIPTFSRTRGKKYSLSVCSAIILGLKVSTNNGKRRSAGVKECVGMHPQHPWDHINTTAYFRSLREKQPMWLSMNIRWNSFHITTTKTRKKSFICD